MTKEMEKKDVVIIAAVILLAAGLLWYFYGGRREPAPLSAPPDILRPGSGLSEEVSSGADVLTILNDLRAISLDKSLWSDPTFLSLTSFETRLVPEPVSRPNPFAPLETPRRGGRR